jgi:hypothetical protein
MTTRFDAIKEFDVNELAEFILTLIVDTENNMLNKLSEYGVEVTVVSLDPQIRHSQIVHDLLEEDDGDT